MTRIWLLFLLLSQILSADPSLFYFSERLNFGDALSPLIVERILGASPTIYRKGVEGPRLLAVGSILHYARSLDCIWGSGVNGKVPLHLEECRKLDVRAVRGPLTRSRLRRAGIACPEIYGDPALLLPLLFPELRPDPQEDFILIPNLNEIDAYAGLPNVVLPTQECMPVIQRILRARRVISGSLHGIVVAESFGIPAILLRLTEVEALFKYQDYYAGTGRKEFPIAYSLEEGISMQCAPSPQIDLQKLLDSFPHDLFGHYQREVELDSTEMPD